MIHEVTMHGATCDNCGDAWYNDHYGWSAMSDDSSLKQMLYDDEWHTDGDKHYCPNCYTLDDDDNLILRNK